MILRNNKTNFIDMKPISINVINLPSRTDRREHVINQFADKPEYSLCVVVAISHQRGAYGLWLTLQQVVSEKLESDSDFFILCEDDHTFTQHYSFELLQHCIEQAKVLNADILSGGVSWFGNAVQISENLFWADKFNGMQFTVIFRKFYQSILDADFGENVVADIHLSGITDNKFVIYPNISAQKEFGYSDVTAKNNDEGYVEGLFKSSSERFDILNKVRNHYFSK